MKTKIIAMIAGLWLALSLVPTPAQAITCFPGTNICEGGDFYHGEDAGYDPAIIVFCNFGDPWDKRKFVKEYMSSTTPCGKDTDQIYIRPGEEMWCKTINEDGWFKAFDATGRHKIDDLWHQDHCTLRED